jgi:FtsH-binding integral membrane protein
MYSDDDVIKKEILGALNLYLDFVNLFLDLLDLFGKRRD